MIWEDEPKRKRTLGINDRQILYRKAGKRCENPTCKKKIDYDEMQVGHKTAYSKGGATTLTNSACLCYRCNKLQGTDSWAVFLRKQNVSDPKKVKRETVKDRLKSLTITQLKSLSKKHNITVRGRVEEDWFEKRKLPPTKTQYINRLSIKLSISDLKTIPKSVPKKSKAKTKKRKKDDDFSLWEF